MTTQCKPYFISPKQVIIYIYIEIYVTKSIIIGEQVKRVRYSQVLFNRDS